MTDYMMIWTTAGSPEEARGIAESLVAAGLAACVQIDGPITSIYRWQGEMESAEEWRCSIKTRAELFEQVAAAIRNLHTYSVPQVIATPIVAGSPPYLEWLSHETHQRPVE